MERNEFFNRVRDLDPRGLTKEEKLIRLELMLCEHEPEDRDNLESPQELMGKLMDDVQDDSSYHGYYYSDVEGFWYQVLKPTPWNQLDAQQKVERLVDLASQSVMVSLKESGVQVIFPEGFDFGDFSDGEQDPASVLFHWVEVTVIGKEGDSPVWIGIHHIEDIEVIVP